MMSVLKRRVLDVHDESTGAGSQAAVLDPVEAGARAEVDQGVQVIYGASVQTLPLAGLRLAEVRPILQTILRVDPLSRVIVNGRPVRTDYMFTSRDVLEFVHHAGEKGRTA
jgi:hypothetical protein